MELFAQKVLVEETEVEAYHDRRGDYHDRERGGREGWERDGLRCSYQNHRRHCHHHRSQSIPASLVLPVDGIHAEVEGSRT